MIPDDYDWLGSSGPNWRDATSAAIFAGLLLAVMFVAVCLVYRFA